MPAGGRTCVDMEDYYLLSAQPDAERFGQIVRAHWAIENSLHWVLDVSMDEDHAQGQRRGLPGGHPAPGSEHRANASRQAIRSPQVPERHGRHVA